MKPPNTLDSPTLLLVEDDEAMRELLLEELSEQGYRVLPAKDGRQGAELARKHTVDLVVTDLRMPEIDGFDLIRDIRSSENAPPILMITAFGSIETAIKAVKLGAADYLTKPFEIDQLVLAVNRALEERLLRKEVARLRKQVEAPLQFENIVARSTAMQSILKLIDRVASSQASVLITGESGTGKELIARSIHRRSSRGKGAFVGVNVAALPAALLESELFGHKKGAFTDAHQDRQGLFEEANGGTIFLDEIGEMAAELQAKLLRVLQEQEVRPVGGAKTVRIDVRVLAATHRDLETLMSEGKFREDLYYRLNVIDLHIPPLRERPEDIAGLVQLYLEKASQRTPSSGSWSISAAATKALAAYRWPGNARELYNVLERGIALSSGQVVDIDVLPLHVREPKQNDFLDQAASKRFTLAELERVYIERVLDEEAGNKTRAAARLGLDRKTLYRKLDEYGKERRQTTGSEEPE